MSSSLFRCVAAAHSCFLHSLYDKAHFHTWEETQEIIFVSAFSASSVGADPSALMII